MYASRVPSASARRRTALRIGLPAAVLSVAALSIGGADGAGASAPALALPDTGQTASYTPTYGEDSDHRGRQPSYADNGDGTITDRVTGLMWQKKDGGEMSFDEAVAYCAGLELGGHADWRLPTAHELYSINWLEAIGPALDRTAFPDDFESDALAEGIAAQAGPRARTAAEQYVRELYWWSSDQRADAADRAWVTNAGGGIGAHMKSETASADSKPRGERTRYIHVRAVRYASAAPSLQAARFADGGDGTAVDQWTGLEWQRSASSSSYTWEEALEAVNALNAGEGYAGHRDWRLPNIRELFSLVDVSKMRPCIDDAVFDLAALSPFDDPSDPRSAGALWSSTSMHNADPKASSQAWDLHDLFSGIVSYSAKTARERVLLVRDGG
jgi:hypothetical protein